MLKRYPLRDSRLYGLRSKKRLAALLNLGLPELRQLIAREDNYHVFIVKDGTRRPRVIEAPVPI